MIYLDNAATSWPKPESVYQTMDEFLRKKGGNPSRGSHSLAIAAQDVVEETRLLLSRLINAPDKERVIFTLNCTDALNLGLKGLLQPGDHVITSCIEHNSVVRPLVKLQRQGIAVTRLMPSPEAGIVLASDIEEAITRDTKLLVITHASNITGVIQPIEEYGVIAKKYGVIFMVDAAQTAGKYPIDTQAGNIDIVALSGHKGLFGPPGTGVLYVGERVEIEPLREGGTGSHSELEEQPLVLPYRYESGTLNSVGISGLGAGLKYISKESLEKIRAHEQLLMEKLIQGLAAIPGVTTYMAGKKMERVPAISINIIGYAPGDVGAILDQKFDIKVRTGLHCAPSAHRVLGTCPAGTVRLSPGYFNTVEEIYAVLEAIESIAKTDMPGIGREFDKELEEVWNGKG